VVANNYNVNYSSNLNTIVLGLFSLVIYIDYSNKRLPDGVNPPFVGACNSFCAVDIRGVSTASANNTAATTVVGRRRHCTRLQVYSIISQRPQKFCCFVCVCFATNDQSLIESDSGWLPLSFDSLTAICTGKIPKTKFPLSIPYTYIIFS